MKEKFFCRDFMDKFLHFWREVEKHLLSQDAVDTLLYGPVSEGVPKFRTPSSYTLSRTL